MGTRCPRGPFRGFYGRGGVVTIASGCRRGRGSGAGDAEGGDPLGFAARSGKCHLPHRELRRPGSRPDVPPPGSGAQWGGARSGRTRAATVAPPRLRATKRIEVEEREGFEPSVPFGTHDFQSCPFGHSGTSPGLSKFEERVGVEPTLDLRPNLISNQALSATQPPLRVQAGLFITAGRRVHSHCDEPTGERSPSRQMTRSDDSSGSASSPGGGGVRGTCVAPQERDGS